ncbi:MAG: penicillin-binding protein 2 [Chloroflexi bacterium]|nr:penicillin-binding protein 2 [Chloroflexota bacterium]
MPVSPRGNLQGPPDDPIVPFEPLLDQPVSRRFLLLKGGVLAAFGALAVRLWQMQIADGRQYAAQAEQNRIDAQPIPAPRGVIYDRNGIVLAGNKANWSVTIVPANLPRDEPARKALFADLNRLLAPPWVLALLPRRIPAGAEPDILARVAAALNRPAAEIAQIVGSAVAANQMPILSQEVPASAAPTLQRALAGAPGVLLLSRPEFLVWDSAADPRLPLIVQHDVPRDMALRLEGNSLLLPGVGIQPAPGRAYPSGTVAAHVVGYVGRVDADTQARVLTPTGQPVYANDDTLGQSGMEAILESHLRGKKGFHVVEVDINRRIIRELENQPPAPGASVALTIDLGLQKAASDALNLSLLRAGVAAGAAVAIDPSTGEVLALVTLPTYNSQAFSDGLSTTDYQRLITDPNQPLFNRGVGGLYAPGAALMPFVALGALADKVIDGSTIHRCTGGAYIPAEYNEISRRLFRCWQPRGHGPLTVASALAQSCDVFFHNLSVPAIPDARGKPLRYYEADVGGQPIEFKGLGSEKLAAAITAFGFGRTAGIELAGEQGGLVPTPEWKREQGDRGAWTVGDTINIGVGQGDLQVTPLQMAIATAALANGGTLYRPRLLKSILRDGNRLVEEQSPVVTGRIPIERTHLDQVREGMRLAVSQGTAAGRVTVPGVVVAGKTGTAETETADEQGRAAQKPHAWFTAFAPYENPKIALAVILEKGGAGAEFAAPVAEHMLRAFFGKP